MNIRLLATLAVSAFLLQGFSPKQAQAESFTITYTPATGAAPTFVLDDAAPVSTNGTGNGYAFTMTEADGSQTNGIFDLYNTDFGWLGGFDVFIATNPGTSEYYNGPKLYTENGTADNFLAGIYTLTNHFGTDTATLLVAPSDTTRTSAGTITAATPEPSSLLLLGTSLIGAVGAIRRRIT